jgi:diphosphomevalonate decarboxylase
MKATCKSHPDIALIKYWGKENEAIRIPMNNSIAMSLASLHSVCTVEFLPQLEKDDVQFVGKEAVTRRGVKRIIKVLDRIREKAGFAYYAKLRTKNNFPKGVGISSSGSGLSAVTAATAAAAGLDLSKKELSKLSRLASGSACRSIQPGFKEWKKGTNHEDSYAVSLFPADHWEIYDLVVMVTKKMKKVHSTSGHQLALTSPFFKTRLKGIEEKLHQLKTALREKDFTKLGKLTEEEALNFHAVCLTSRPSLIYWQPATLAVMRKVQTWRKEQGLEAYFTLDAGPTVHVLTEKKNVNFLEKRLEKIEGVEKVVANKPGTGAEIIEKHLF